MNSEMKEAWIKALRDGSYKQGRKQLRSNNKFCCLGVLADINWPDDWVDNGTKACPYNIDEPETVMELQGHVIDDDESDWMDLEMNEGELTRWHRLEANISIDEQGVLIRMNDGHKYGAAVMSNTAVPAIDLQVRSSINAFYVEGFEPKSFAEIADHIEKEL